MNSNKPSYNIACFAIRSYRVEVAAAFNLYLLSICTTAKSVVVGGAKWGVPKLCTCAWPTPCLWDAKINLHRASPLASFTGLFCFRLLLCMAERYFGPRSLAPDTELDLFLFQHFGLGNQGNGEECEGFCESVTHKIQDRLCSRTAGNLLCILYLYVLWLDYRFLIESYDYCTAFDKHCIVSVFLD